MYYGSMEEIIGELERIEREELRWNDDCDKMQDAIILLKDYADVVGASKLLDELSYHLDVGREHTHENCMGIELPAIHRDAILFWKCDDGQFRSAWPEDSPLHQKAEEAIKTWRECDICHQKYGDHKLSCGNNPHAPIKIPTSYFKYVKAP